MFHDQFQSTIKRLPFFTDSLAATLALLFRAQLWILLKFLHVCLVDVLRTTFPLINIHSIGVRSE